MGHGTADGPWLPIRGAVHAGHAYVGNVGGKGVVDFTALGDMINTASGMQTHAGTGQFLLGESVYVSASQRFPELARRSLQLQGRAAPVSARVLEHRI